MADMFDVGQSLGGLFGNLLGYVGSKISPSFAQDWARYRHEQALERLKVTNPALYNYYIGLDMGLSPEEAKKYTIIDYYKKQAEINREKALEKLYGEQGKYYGAETEGQRIRNKYLPQEKEAEITKTREETKTEKVRREGAQIQNKAAQKELGEYEKNKKEQKIKELKREYYDVLDRINKYLITMNEELSAEPDEEKRKKIRERYRSYIKPLQDRLEAIKDELKTLGVQMKKTAPPNKGNNEEQNKKAPFTLEDVKEAAKKAIIPQGTDWYFKTGHDVRGGFRSSIAPTFNKPSKGNNAAESFMQKHGL